MIEDHSMQCPDDQILMCKTYLKRESIAILMVNPMQITYDS